MFVYLAETERVTLAAEIAFYFDEVLAIAPAVKKCEPQRIVVCISLKAPFALFCCADIIVHSREVLR